MHVITDQGSKLGKIIVESRWHVAHHLDTNHAVKTFDRHWEEMGEDEKRLPHGLKDRIMKWLNRILHSNETKEKKIYIWENCLCHYSGNHKTYLNTTHARYLWRKRKIQQRSKCWQELYRPRQSWLSHTAQIDDKLKGKRVTMPSKQNISISIGFPKAA
jgi:hypothetical protein